MIVALSEFDDVTLAQAIGAVARGEPLRALLAMKLVRNAPASSVVVPPTDLLHPIR
mgnify:CR=1